MSDPIPRDVAEAVAKDLYAGQKIQAIETYRDHSGKGLKEAKEFVEALEAELRAREPEKFSAPAAGNGCVGMVALCGLALFAVAALLVRG